MKTYGTADVQIHVILTLALVGDEWLASCPGHFTHREKARGTYCIGGSMGPEISLDDVERRKTLTY
jgi:hypothetical protein